MPASNQVVTAQRRGTGLVPMIVPALALLGGCEFAADTTPSGPDSRPPPVESVTRDGEFRSNYLQASLIVCPSVFPPDEAEALLLPLMHDHEEIFRDRRILDIGTGTGIIGLYAARLGAAQVVATDIQAAAISCVAENAARLELSHLVEGRLVAPDDISAYSSVGFEEVFDVIISNPPYSLDLDAEAPTAVIDNGDLGFSILRGLDQHLSADGVALLFYNSLFYQQVMVKFARHLGFDVRHHQSYGITAWELESLFNLYLGRILEREGVERDALRFDDQEDRLPFAMNPPLKHYEPLLGRDTGRVYRGFIAVRRP